MIDWDRVVQLQQEVGDEDFQEVVDIFLEDAGAAIRELVPDMDAKALEANLHYLKGCALNLGFSELADHCQVGETMARNGMPGNVDVAGIVTSYEKSVAEFMEILEARAA